MDPGLTKAFLGLFGLLERQLEPGGSGQVIKRLSKETKSKAQKLAPPESGKRVEEVIQEFGEICSFRFGTGHPRFFSFVPSPASPFSWAGDALSSALNCYAGSSESGAGVCAVEEALITWIAQRFGLPPSAGGQFVSGASMASLTALAVARDQFLDDNERSQGVAYVSEETHFCTKKALNIIGILDDQVRLISCDSHFRMDVDHLRVEILKDIMNGLKPFLVVPTCGTTSTGAVDPLEDIAHIAHEYKLWVHVDAAYGGAVAFSDEHKAKVEGLGLADSIAWDPHKWLFQTLGCGVVLFRHKSDPIKSFSSTAHFLRDVEDDDQYPQNPWNYGIELTRPARHMRLWFSLQCLGMEEIDRMICRGFELADLTQAELEKRQNWQIMSSSSLAVLTFRFAPRGVSDEDLDTINAFISRALEAQNIAAIFTVCMKGVVGLRMCTINPRTRNRDIQEVVQALDHAAQEFYKQKTG